MKAAFQKQVEEVKNLFYEILPHRRCARLFTESHKALDEAGDFTVPEARFGAGSGQRRRRRSGQRLRRAAAGGAFS